MSDEDGSTFAQNFGSQYAGLPFLREMPAHARYLFALGEFVDRFASVERVMRWLLAHVVRVSAEEANALFSGAKVSETMNLVNRFKRASGEEVPAPLKRVFDHLGVINGVRNFVLHYGASEAASLPALPAHERDKSRQSSDDPYHQVFLASNVFFAVSDADVRPVEVSAKILDDLTFDLGMIYFILLVHARSDGRLFENKPKYLQRFAKTEWRYRPAATKAARSNQRL